MSRVLDMCVVVGPRVLNRIGQTTILTLTEAVSPSTEYAVHYAASDTVDLPETSFSPVYKTDGTPLVLTAVTTPLILNLPGAYMIVQNSPDTGNIVMLRATADRISRGDVR